MASSVGIGPSIFAILDLAPRAPVSNFPAFPSLPPHPPGRVFTGTPRWVQRGLHRDAHLDEIDSALKVILK